jgi:hypothetical protein
VVLATPPDTRQDDRGKRRRRRGFSVDLPYAAVDAVHTDPTDPMPSWDRGTALAALPARASTRCSPRRAAVSRRRW